MLVHHTRVGDVLRLAPARGTVTLAPPSERGVLLAAGGTGLATVKALLTEVARRPDPPATWLFFGARTCEDLYEQEELSRRRPLSLAALSSRVAGALPVSHGDAYPYEAGTVVDAVTRRGTGRGTTRT